MELYDYQKEIIEKLYDHNDWALFMSVGTGKTLTALSLINRQGYNKLHKVLVVCRKNKLKEWGEDCGALLKANFKVVTYNKMVDENHEDYDFILLDESQNIKTFSKSTRWKWLKKAKDSGMRFGLLSGTPQHHTYIDYYTTFYLLSIFKNNVTTYKHSFCVYENARNGNYTVLKEYKNTEQLERMLSSDNIVWYFKQELEPIHRRIDFTSNRMDRIMVKDRTYNHLETGEEILITTPSVLWLKRLQLASGYVDGYTDDRKVLQIINIIQRVGSALIFVNYTDELKFISKYLHEFKIPHKIYCGWRKDVITDDDKVVIANTNSGGSGVNNFKHISTAIFNSVPIKYIDFEQAKGRINRIGSKERPCYYYLATPEEVKVYKAHQERKNFDKIQFKK